MASISATLTSADGATWTFRGQANAAALTATEGGGDVAAAMRDLLAQTATVREQSNTALTALVATERAANAAAAPEKRRRTGGGDDDDDDEDGGEEDVENVDDDDDE